MFLPCIYQCHCNLEVATVIFGGRYRQEPELLFAAPKPGDRAGAVCGVRGTGHNELVPEIQWGWDWGGENGAEAPSSTVAACSQAHRIMLVSVLIKVFQGQFEL